MNQEAADFWTRALQALRTASRTASADPDAAASRAYYAAFYAVSALFALEEKTFSRHSARGGGAGRYPGNTSYSMRRPDREAGTVSKCG